jgi:hypothetical protein
MHPKPNTTPVEPDSNDVWAANQAKLDALPEGHPFKNLGQSIVDSLNEHTRNLKQSTTPAEPTTDDVGAKYQAKLDALPEGHISKNLAQMVLDSLSAGLAAEAAQDAEWDKEAHAKGYPGWQQMVAAESNARRTRR